jgi:hypothetical protein
LLLGFSGFPSHDLAPGDGDATLTTIGLFASGWLPSQRGTAVIEELFQPTIDDGGLELKFSAEMQDRNLIEQMTAENGHLFLRRVTLACFPHNGSLSIKARWSSVDVLV